MGIYECNKGYQLTIPDSPREISPSIRAQAETQNIEAIVQNGAVEISVAATSEESRAIPFRTIPPNHSQPSDQEPAPEAPSIPPNETTKLPAEAADQVVSQPEVAEKAAPQAPRANGTASPPSDTSSRRGKGRKKRGRQSPLQNDASHADRNQQTEPQSTDLPQAAEPATKPFEQESGEPEVEKARRERTSSRSPPSLQLAEETAAVDQTHIEDSAPQPAKAQPEPGADEVGPQETEQPRTRSRTPASVQPETSSAAGIAPNDVNSKPVSSEITGKGRRGRKPRSTEPTEAPDTTKESNELSAVAEEPQVTSETATTEEPTQRSPKQLNGVEKSQKRAGRPKKQAAQLPQPLETDAKKRQRDEAEERDQPAEGSVEKQADSEASLPGKRRKQQKDRQPTPRQEEQREPQTEKQSRAGRRKQREEPSVIQDERPEPDAEAEAAQTKEPEERSQEQTEKQSEPEAAPQQTRLGRGKKQRKDQDPTPEQQEPLEAERTRAKKGKKRQQQAPPQEQEEREPEPDVEQESQRPQHTKPRGRHPTTQPEEAQDTTTEKPQPKKRKPREPRGETVPVTVHRLANPGSLGGAPVESDSEDEAELPEQIAERQPAKLPNRGGVNAADVLTQICRETLEKILTSLKEEISKENNAATRANYMLRRKAVETYRTELEGRLFDLSEMLDSNFVLGTKIKKAKRSMLDQRSRLDHVRRERESVALRMDAVRREHSREENAGIVSPLPSLSFPIPNPILFELTMQRLALQLTTPYTTSISPSNAAVRIAQKQKRNHSQPVWSFVFAMWEVM